MAASAALNVPGEGSATTADPTAVPQAAAAPRWPQLIPIAQLLAVVLGVFAIIWNQQQTTDNLRAELRAEISDVETGLKAEISQLRLEINGVETRLGAEISELRAEVAENGQRLARIEGFLGIGVPEDAAPGGGL